MGDNQSWKDFLNEVHENSKRYMAHKKESECESCKIQSDESATLKQDVTDHGANEEA